MFHLTHKGAPANAIYTLDCYLSQTLAQLEGNASYYADPSKVGAGLDSDLASFGHVANSWCGGLTGSDQAGDASCSPANIAALVKKYQDKFIAYLRANQVQDYFDGTTVLYFVQAGKTLYDYATGAARIETQGSPTSVIPNALNNSAPTGTYIPQAQSTSVLNPPTGGTPITQQQIVNGQTLTPNPQIVYMNATQNGGVMDEASSWVKDNWPMLAVAAGGLVALSMFKK